jgi:hypothetical protein
MIAIQELNKTVQLSIVERNGDAKSLAVLFKITNISGDYVTLPKDTGLSFYTYDEKTRKWIQLQDRILYRNNPDGDIVLPPKRVDILSSDFIVTLDPNLKFLKNRLVRAVVVGKAHKQNVNPDRRVGAYLDFELRQ